MVTSLVIAITTGILMNDSAPTNEPPHPLRCRVIVEKGVVESLGDASVEVNIRNVSGRRLQIEYHTVPIEQVEFTLLTEDGVSVIDSCNFVTVLALFSVKARQFELETKGELTRSIPLAILSKAETITNGVYRLRISYESQNHLKCDSVDVYVRVKKK